MKRDYILVFDIGTGSTKAVLYDENGRTAGESEQVYPTYFPYNGWNEQAPDDWWKAMLYCTKQLLEKTDIPQTAIKAISVSGHCFGVVPIDKSGKLLRKTVPIWSDMRAQSQAERLTDAMGDEAYYYMTGTDVPASRAACKIMWYMDNEPEMMKQVDAILGTKDYLNFRLTGRKATDHSYASGSGLYDLGRQNYAESLITAAGILPSVLPEILSSDSILGELTSEAKKALGLTGNVKVVCGGADTCCMALGAAGYRSGRIHTSLGSSAFLAVVSDRPVFNYEEKLNTFAHMIPGLYVATKNLHSAGNSFKWVQNTLCADLPSNSFETLTEIAKAAPIGSNKLIFYPTLSFGGPQDRSLHVKGAYTGLDLRHEKKDLIRAAMEGIALSLGWSYQELKKYFSVTDEMLLVGGGSKSDFWTQIFADVFNIKIRRMRMGQSVGACGAAAAAAVGTGIWSDYSVLDEINKDQTVVNPIADNVKQYKELFQVFKEVARYQSDIGDMLYDLKW